MRKWLVVLCSLVLLLAMIGEGAVGVSVHEGKRSLARHGRNPEERWQRHTGRIKENVDAKVRKQERENPRARPVLSTKEDSPSFSQLDMRRKRYDGYSLVRLEGYPDMNSILSDPQLLVDTPGIDVWFQSPSRLDLLLSPMAFDSLTPIFPSWKVVEVDIQNLLEAEHARTRRRQRWTGTSGKNEFFEEFRDYNEFLEYYAELLRTYPKVLSNYTIGQTVEGRDIIALKLSTGGNKPSIFIEGTAHAREWLSPTTSLFVVVKMLEGYASGDATATRLVESIDWHVVPILNADGYVFTWNGDRLWRKNRRRNSATSYGVDLNRNWGPDNTWCTSGSSTLPNSDTYCGTAPFSEPESAASAKASTSLPNLSAVISYHCYGPLLLRPFQYSYSQPPEPYNTEVTNLGKELEATINSVHNARYESIQGSSLYPHSGGAIDYSYFTSGVPAYTIELRGNGFIVPASEIILAGEENYAGIIVLANHILAKSQ